MPLYLDNDVSGDVARLLRQAGHSLLTASDVGLANVGDHEQLITATKMRRVLVSHNAKDYRLLHDAWRRWTEVWRITRPHAGILIIPQPPTWSSPRAAHEIADFFSLELVIENELYEWRRGTRRWERRAGARTAST